jgi:hypothetical protein
LSSPVKFECAVDQAEWAWLKPHLHRDAVWMVRAPIDLLQVARDIAEDHALKIQAFLNEGSLFKLDSVQIELWNQDPLKKFNIVIVQPFVLVQEL